jgi:hypothetical protein
MEHIKTTPSRAFFKVLEGTRSIQIRTGSLLLIEKGESGIKSETTANGRS